MIEELAWPTGPESLCDLSVDRLAPGALRKVGHRILPLGRSPIEVFSSRNGSIAVKKALWAWAEDRDIGSCRP
jgi:hypothetical protein